MRSGGKKKHQKLYDCEHQDVEKKEKKELRGVSEANKGTREQLRVKHSAESANYNAPGAERDKAVLKQQKGGCKLKKRDGVRVRLDGERR